MTLLAGEEGDPGHGGIGSEGQREFHARRVSAGKYRVTAEIKRRIVADVMGLEARCIGMGVGAVHRQHRHAFSGGEKIPVVGGEAELARCSRRHRGRVGDGQQLQKIVPEHRQAVAGSERMHAGRREAETERLPVQRSLRQIADTNDEMI